MDSNKRFWLLLGAALVIVVIIVGGAGGDGPPLDPRSVNPDGAKGIVEVLESLGATVDLDAAVPRADATAALLLQDRLTVEDRDAVQDWVRGGGVLVVAVTGGPLAQLRVEPQSGDLDRGLCSIAALAGANRITATGWLHEPAVGDESCFGTDAQAFITARSVGAGHIVNVGGPDMFTNARLDKSDAAVVAVALLAPDPETARVAFVGASVVDFGESGGLGELVAPRVRNAIIQLLAAFLIYALFRMRRLGGVVQEPLPVRIEGSELVLQAGRLSERAGDPGSAATIIRDDFVHRARRALAVGDKPGTAVDVVLVELVAARTGSSAEQVRHGLTSPVTTEADLIDVASLIARLDRDLLGQPTESTSTNGRP